MSIIETLQSYSHAISAVLETDEYFEAISLSSALRVHLEVALYFNASSEFPTEAQAESLHPFAVATLFLLLAERSLPSPSYLINVVLKGSNQLPPNVQTLVLAHAAKITRNPLLFKASLQRIAQYLDVKALNVLTLPSEISYDPLFTVLHELMSARMHARTFDPRRLFSLTDDNLLRLCEEYGHFLLLPPTSYTDPDSFIDRLLSLVSNCHTSSYQLKRHVIQTLSSWLGHDAAVRFLVSTPPDNWRKHLNMGDIAQFWVGNLLRLKAPTEHIDRFLNSLTSRDVRLAAKSSKKMFAKLMAEPQEDELLDYLKGHESRFFPQRGGVEFHATLWGDTFYFSATQNFSLKSLFSTQAFIRLKTRHPVSIVLHTTRESLPKCESLRQLCEQNNVQLRLAATLGHSDSGAVYRRGLAWMIGLRSAATRGATVVTLIPEGIYGEGIDKLIENCPEGGASLGCLIRVSQSKVLKYLKDAAWDNLLIAPSMRNFWLAERGLRQFYHPVQIMQYGGRLKNITFSTRPPFSILPIEIFVGSCGRQLN